MTARALALLLALASAARGQEAQPPSARAASELAVTELTWDARAAEHLWNRAGFGARPADLERWVAAGPRALVEHLLAPAAWEEPPWVEPLVPDRSVLRRLTPDERRERVVALRRANVAQQRAWVVSWIERMLSDEAPLQERMTLFWHGFFTSQASKVRASHSMIEQNLLFREHALGNYGRLLRAILRDPALLVYLDNDESEAEHPNENLARELLELFSLGEGNYSEQDVREMARALTGHGVRDGAYRFDRRGHDHGTKTVLGVSGPLDLDDVVDAILEQPACARHVALRLIGYLEGVPPQAARLERYAALLRAEDYELQPLLRALFLDPDFYRPEVVGARVLSPVDYLVGTSRRLGVRPPAAALALGAGLLGEQLLEPPGVKGWEGGEAWITTAALIDRGNLAGLLLGVVDLQDLRAPDPLMEPAWPGDDASPAEPDPAELAEMLAVDETQMSREMAPEMEMAPELERDEERRETPPLARVLRVLDTAAYRPGLNLTARLEALGARSEREIVDALLDELLAIEAPRETRRRLAAGLRAERERRKIAPGELLGAGPRVERLLRRLAHRILSLPEAQLG